MKLVFAFDPSPEGAVGSDTVCCFVVSKAGDLNFVLMTHCRGNEERGAERLTRYLCQSSGKDFLWYTHILLTWTVFAIQLVLQVENIQDQSNAFLLVQVYMIFLSK